MQYLLAFLTLFVLEPCWAGSVYKSVGPDGKPELVDAIMNNQVTGRRD